MPGDLKTTTGRMRTIDPKSSEICCEPYDNLPCFEVKASVIPESEEWEVGEDYDVQVRVTQKSVKERGGENWVEFKIKKIKAL